ncbi:hypothetical protein B0H11DRAFT_1938223 [Mycena galericulata]|nr:hypothetical protein B0H11DRAFT_1938223 [Mycena galericulata]
MSPQHFPCNRLAYSVLGTQNSSRNFPRNQDLTSSTWVTCGAESTGRHNSVRIDRVDPCWNREEHLQHRDGAGLAAHGNKGSRCRQGTGCRRRASVDGYRGYRGRVPDDDRRYRGRVLGDDWRSTEGSQEERKASKGSKPALIIKPNRYIGRPDDGVDPVSAKYEKLVKMLLTSPMLDQAGTNSDSDRFQIKKQGGKESAKAKVQKQWEGRQVEDIANVERHEGREEKRALS